VFKIKRRARRLAKAAQKTTTRSGRNNEGGDSLSGMKKGTKTARARQ